MAKKRGEEGYGTATYPDKETCFRQTVQLNFQNPSNSKKQKRNLRPRKLAVLTYLVVAVVVYGLNAFLLTHFSTHIIC